MRITKYILKTFVSARVAILSASFSSMFVRATYSPPLAEPVFCFCFQMWPHCQSLRKGEGNTPTQRYRLERRHETSHSQMALWIQTFPRSCTSQEQPPPASPNQLALRGNHQLQDREFQRREDVVPIAGAWPNPWRPNLHSVFIVLARHPTPGASTD